MQVQRNKDTANEKREIELNHVVSSPVGVLNIEKLKTSTMKFVSEFYSSPSWTQLVHLSIFILSWFTPPGSFVVFSVSMHLKV